MTLSTIEPVVTTGINTIASDSADVLNRTRRVALEVAPAWANVIDTENRFPTETLAALKSEGLLSYGVPRAFGGQGATMAEIALQCATLAKSCGSSAMVLAMHNIQVACVARHHGGAPFFESILRGIVSRQTLLASVVSEVGTSGDTRSSICAPEFAGGKFSLNKRSTTVSYASAADGFLITARRNKEAPTSDQILVFAARGDIELKQTGTWDPLGMRGTCSPGFDVVVNGPVSQIFSESYAEISAMTMVPYSHILWSALWWGIAADAVSRASSFVRAEARKNPGVMPLGASRLVQTRGMLQLLRDSWSSSAIDFDAIVARGRQKEELGMSWALRMNGLKISSSELAHKIVHEALQIIGVLGYKNDSSFSVGRHYRDILSASLMISNDRILGKSAALSLMVKD
jgi:acyl-CoA dehydrogenase